MIRVLKERFDPASDYDEFEELITGQFWTRENEIQEDFEELGAEVYDINGEYIDFVFDDTEYVAYFGHANSTMWVKRIKKF